MKTLIVKYLPRGDYSHTKKLLDAFCTQISGEVTTLDLLKDIPDFFDEERVMSYIRQNYLDEELNNADKALMSKMERFASDVKDADIVVLATPMYNFSYPALVKAWFDSVMLKNITWTQGSEGYEGLCTSSKAVLLFASGGAYEGEAAAWDHLTPIINQSFGFMGFTEVHKVTAGGLNLPDSDQTAIVHKAEQDAAALAAELYK